MAPESLLPCSQKLATSPCSDEPDEYNRKSETLRNTAQHSETRSNAGNMHIIQEARNF